MLFSIIIPYYNNSSCLNYLFITLNDYKDKNCEIIIIDDYSSIEEYNILLDRVKLYNSKNIKILRNKENMGASFSRQKGVDNSCGSFIAFLDADDGWVKNRAFLICKYMKDNEIDIFGGAPNYISSNDFITFREKSHHTPKSCKKLKFSNFLYKNYYSTPSVVMRKDIFLSQRFNTNMRYSEDFEFWRRAVLLNNAELLCDSGIFCFKHSYISENVNSLSSATNKMAKSEIYGMWILLSNSEIPFYLKLLVPIAIMFSFFKYIIRVFHIKMVKLLRLY